MGLVGLYPNSPGHGLLCDWQQSCGNLIVAGGDSRVIQLWDAKTELVHQEIQNCSEVPLSCLNSSKMNDFMLASGSMDGAVRVYDKRLTRPGRYPLA